MAGHHLDLHGTRHPAKSHTPTSAHGVRYSALVPSTVTDTCPSRPSALTPAPSSKAWPPGAHAALANAPAAGSAKVRARCWETNPVAETFAPNPPAVPPPHPHAVVP